MTDQALINDTKDNVLFACAAAIRQFLYALLNVIYVQRKGRKGKDLSDEINHPPLNFNGLI
jgi:hypothetical protein